MNYLKYLLINVEIELFILGKTNVKIKSFWGQKNIQKYDSNLLGGYNYEQTRNL